MLLSANGYFSGVLSMESQTVNIAPFVLTRTVSGIALIQLTCHKTYLLRSIFIIHSLDINTIKTVYNLTHIWCKKFKK